MDGALTAHVIRVNHKDSVLHKNLYFDKKIIFCHQKFVDHQLRIVCDSHVVMIQILF
jgi:hypothetical protein